MHVDRESLNDYPMGEYDVTVTISTFVQDREIAWKILGKIRPQIGHIYGYTLEPTDGRTFVTSYHDWSEIDPVYREAGIFPVDIRIGVARNARHSRPHCHHSVSGLLTTTPIIALPTYVPLCLSAYPSPS